MKKVNESVRVKKLMKSAGLIKVDESGIDDSRASIEKNKTYYVNVFKEATDAVNKLGGNLTGVNIEDTAVQLIGVARKLERMLNSDGYNIKL